MRCAELCKDDTNAQSQPQEEGQRQGDTAPNVFQLHGDGVAQRDIGSQDAVQNGAQLPAPIAIARTGNSRHGSMAAPIGTPSLGRPIVQDRSHLPGLMSPSGTMRLGAEIVSGGPRLGPEIMTGAPRFGPISPGGTPRRDPMFQSGPQSLGPTMRMHHGLTTPTGATHVGATAPNVGSRFGPSFQSGAASLDTMYTHRGPTTHTASVHIGATAPNVASHAGYFGGSLNVHDRGMTALNSGLPRRAPMGRTDREGGHGSMGQSDHARHAPTTSNEDQDHHYYGNPLKMLDEAFGACAFIIVL